MYKRILVPLENSPYDAAIVDHVRELARLHGSSLILMHVADGFAARNVKQLNLRESEEMRVDRDYLEKTCASLASHGLQVECVLAGGDPGKEIAEAAAREQFDLIAMSTHGHRFFSDLVYGSVAESVRHRSTIPVLMVRGTRASGPSIPRGSTR